MGRLEVRPMSVEATNVVNGLPPAVIPLLTPGIVSVLLVATVGSVLGGGIPVGVERIVGTKIRMYAFAK